MQQCGQGVGLAILGGLCLHNFFTSHGFYPLVSNSWRGPSCVDPLGTTVGLDPT